MTRLEMPLLSVALLAIAATVTATGCGAIRMSAARAPAAPITPQEAAQTAQKAGERPDPEAAAASVAPDGPAGVRGVSQGASKETAVPDPTLDELVVDREVVERCASMRRVRDGAAHASPGPADPDKTWIAALQAIAECMTEGGALAHDSLGVSGDEEHRHLIRQVLSSRGIAPTRVIALRIVGDGAAECQGGGGCTQPVVIAIAPNR